MPDHNRDQRHEDHDHEQLARAPAGTEAPGKRTLTEGVPGPLKLIAHSVGEGGQNDRKDVSAIQRALKRHGYDPGALDAKLGPRTVAAIRAIQSSLLAHADGLVEPGGKTERFLLARPSRGTLVSHSQARTTTAPARAEHHAPTATGHVPTAATAAAAPEHTAAAPVHAAPAHAHAAAGDAFKVDAGQLTFDAEGTEGGRYHTRKAHWPGGASGVTLGRGYDLGQHTAAKIVADFRAAGISEAVAHEYATAKGLTGPRAAAWLAKHRASLAEITPEQQEALFRATYQEHLEDVEGISGRYAASTAKARHGHEADFDIDFSRLDPVIKDILVDLRYRGDYTHDTRIHVQPPAIANDLAALARVMADRSKWSRVPKDRFDRRNRYLQQALAKAPKPDMQG